MEPSVPTQVSKLAVCALEWRSAVADAVVETHDRIAGKTWREAKRACDVRADGAKAALKETLQAFSSHAPLSSPWHQTRHRYRSEPLGLIVVSFGCGKRAGRG